MRPKFALLFSMLVLSGCADERIIEGSRSFSASVSHLQQQEVIDNIDETIDEPYRIPRRTTFGKGSLQFADAATLQVSVPLHLFDKNAGSASGSAGSENNTYQLSIAPDTDGPALKILREIYQGAVYPDAYPLVSSALQRLVSAKDKHFIYWGGLDAQTSNAPPGTTAFRMGQGQRHSIWTDDPDAFERFVLLTFGTSPESDRVTDASNPALVKAFGTQPRQSVRPSLRKRHGNASPPKQRKDVGFPPISIPSMPKPASEKRLIDKEDEIKGFSLFPHAAPGIPQLQVK